jgi:hypothetical protein
MSAMVGRLGFQGFDRVSLVDWHRRKLGQQLRNATIAGEDAAPQNVKPRAK